MSAVRKMRFWIALLGMLATGVPSLLLAGPKPGCVAGVRAALEPVSLRRLTVSRGAEKQLKKIPGYIVEGMETWMQEVRNQGLYEVRRIPGYHDEPLHGDRAGQRSVRLNRAYRVIYDITHDDSGEYVRILEVSNHKY